MIRARDLAHFIALVANLPLFVNEGKRTNRASAIDAVAQWANDQERKLLGLHCGQSLPRERHRAWARDVVSRSRFLMVPGEHWGVVVLTRAGFERECA